MCEKAQKLNKWIYLILHIEASASLDADFQESQILPNYKSIARSVGNMYKKEYFLFLIKNILSFHIDQKVWMQSPHEIAVAAIPFCGADNPPCTLATIQSIWGRSRSYGNEFHYRAYNGVSPSGKLHPRRSGRKR